MKDKMYLMISNLNVNYLTKTPMPGSLQPGRLPEFTQGHGSEQGKTRHPDGLSYGNKKPRRGRGRMVSVEINQKERKGEAWKDLGTGRIT